MKKIFPIGKMLSRRKIMSLMFDFSLRCSGTCESCLIATASACPTMYCPLTVLRKCVAVL